MISMLPGFALPAGTPSRHHPGAAGPGWTMRRRRWRGREKWDAKNRSERGTDARSPLETMGG